MSINTNLNRMAVTYAIRAVQLFAAAYVLYTLPWPLIIAVVLTHAEFVIAALMIPGLAKLMERVLPTNTERESAGRD